MTQTSEHGYIEYINYSQEANIFKDPDNKENSLQKAFCSMQLSNVILKIFYTKKVILNKP